jgi:hypothetical protein
LAVSENEEKHFSGAVLEFIMKGNYVMQGTTLLTPSTWAA